jgi:hypothetical protein
MELYSLQSGAETHVKGSTRWRRRRVSVASFLPHNVAHDQLGLLIHSLSYVAP